MRITFKTISPNTMKIIVFAVTPLTNIKSLSHILGGLLNPAQSAVNTASVSNDPL